MNKKFDLTLDEPKKDTTGIIPPSLFEVNQSLDFIASPDGRYQGIEGEHHARMVILTNFVLGRKPILLKGPRSSGKSNLMGVLSTLCPNPITVSTSSDKAEFRDAGNLNKASHFIIPEINKVNEIVVEILKDMGEGAPTQYKFTDEYKMTQTVTIDPKPFATSIADENKNTGRLGEELLSRMTVINTDASVEQNKRVMKEKLKRAQNPYEERKVSNQRGNEVIEFVKNLPSIRDFTFIYLPGESVLNAIPPQFTDSRRDTDKYIDNTKGISLFHIKDRMVVDYKGKKNVLVTPADAWYNHTIYEEILLQSALKAGPTERKILDILIKGQGQLMTVAEIRNEILNLGLIPSHEVIRKSCDSLAEIGYLTRYEDSRPFKYSLNDAIKNSYTGDIDWNKVIEACKVAVQKQFPTQAQEYIKRYCTTPIKVIHPFTGEELNISDNKPKEIIKSPKEFEEKYFPEATKKKQEDEKMKKPQPAGISVSKKKEDPIELLRQKILDLIKDEQEWTFEDLVEEVRIDMSYEEDEIEREVKFLQSFNELFYKNGKVKILK